jgi:hypothetical protein
MRVEKSSCRVGQIREQRCQVLRPRSRAPDSNTGPSLNLSPATDAEPYLKAQPPSAEPSAPSGSCTTPSSDVNSMTITLLMCRPPVGLSRRCLAVAP